ncbi:MAG TPA: sulfite exporter TauE/SafE family protein [Methylomirabilota bacterium]|jgi:uncharacterized membrane protein YfcA|nr:sulfite exporter TauE/SafE family protein [Methylomirabilota bacterium]
MPLAAWIGALAIGLSLGLLGSGGSILTVPVLMYLADQHGKVAIAESLLIVGVIAFVGGIPYAVKRLTRWPHVLLFGLPGLAGSYGGAALGAFIPVAVQLALFAVMMVVAGVMLLRPQQEDASRTQPVWQLGLYGAGVGVATGLVGVGGGFLIVPALTLLGGLPMHNAVASSLWIIALNSASGFAKYFPVLETLGLQVQWDLVGLFSLLGISGSIVGNLVSVRLPQAALRRFFAYFLFAMGSVMLWQNLPRALG